MRTDGDSADQILSTPDRGAEALRRFHAVDALIQEQRSSQSKKGTVYFAAAGPVAIKIGVASDPVRRIRELQRGNHREIVLLATTKGGRLAERHYHQRFAAHQIRAEWFERCPEIEAEIARLKAEAEV